MSVWFDKKQQKKNIADYLVDKGFLSISIYGLGAVGRLLYNELEDSPIEVKYGIDQERPYFFDNNRAFKPGEILEKVDAVIVTPVYYYPEIKETLKKMRCPILSLKDVVDSM